jgi:hypothetical protein
MKKNYQEMQLDIVIFDTGDLIRTSSDDNITDMPEFPENFNP